MMTLPTDSAARKDVPVYRGAVNYFPAAIAGVAGISFRGNAKHNPGEPLHHARGKSTDHTDCIVRHLMDVHDLIARFNREAEMAVEESEQVAAAVLEEVDQMAWRALAFSQELHERYGGAPLAPGAREP